MDFYQTFQKIKDRYFEEFGEKKKKYQATPLKLEISSSYW